MSPLHGPAIAVGADNKNIAVNTTTAFTAIFSIFISNLLFSKNVNNLISVPYILTLTQNRQEVEKN